MHRLIILFLALTLPLLAEDRQALIKALVAGDDQLGRITLAELVETTSGRKVLPFQPDKDKVCSAILQAVQHALTEALKLANVPESPLRKTKRINETSKFFEDQLLALLSSTSGFVCEIPKTAEGKEQRSGYPDLRLTHQETGRITYLDPKVYAAASEDSSFRTFYFEPSEGRGKINDDAHHLILGIRHDGKTGRWTYTGWKIVDVSQLELQLKSEFNASNRDLYRPEAIKRASP
jgi:hypothetical protein